MNQASLGDLSLGQMVERISMLILPGRAFCTCMFAVRNSSSRMMPFSAGGSGSDFDIAAGIGCTICTGSETCSI